jgi:protein-disulfide isomerase
MQEHVRRDFEDGVRAGIYGTPTFFIDGSPVVGSSSEELGEAVDRALGAHRP